MPVVNPCLFQCSTGELVPAAIEGETLILKRRGLVMDCKLAGPGKLSGKGDLFLTSHRLVFIATESKSRQDFGSLSVSLSELTEVPCFEQPIFGANYLRLSTADSFINLRFYEGGCGTFLPCLYQVYERRRDPSNSSVVMAIISGSSPVAFVDPNDPTTFYFSQPKL